MVAADVASFWPPPRSYAFSVCGRYVIRNFVDFIAVSTEKMTTPRLVARHGYGYRSAQ
jgi:hypothetical protein